MAKTLPTLSFDKELTDKQKNSLAEADKQVKAEKLIGSTAPRQARTNNEAEKASERAAIEKAKAAQAVKNAGQAFTNRQQNTARQIVKNAGKQLSGKQTAEKQATPVADMGRKMVERVTGRAGQKLTDEQIALGLVTKDPALSLNSGAGIIGRQAERKARFEQAAKSAELESERQKQAIEAQRQANEEYKRRFVEPVETAKKDADDAAKAYQDALNMWVSASRGGGSKDEVDELWKQAESWKFYAMTKAQEYSRIHKQAQEAAEAWEEAREDAAKQAAVRQAKLEYDLEQARMRQAETGRQMAPMLVREAGERLRQTGPETYGFGDYAKMPAARRTADIIRAAAYGNLAGYANAVGMIDPYAEAVSQDEGSILAGNYSVPQMRTAGQAHMQSLARQWNELGQTSLERAKADLSTGGQVAVEIGVAALQMLGDIAITQGRGTIYAMTVRAGGGYGMEAARDGASQDEQFVYGLAGGAVEAVTEKLFAAAPLLNRVFGKPIIKADFVDSAIKSLARTAKSPTGRAIVDRAAHGLLAMTSEGAEEVLADFMEPVIRKATYDRDSRISWDLEQMLHDGIIGAALGGLGVPGIIARSGQVRSGYELDEALDKYQAAIIEHGILSDEAREASMNVWRMTGKLSTQDVAAAVSERLARDPEAAAKEPGVRYWLAKSRETERAPAEAQRIEDEEEAEPVMPGAETQRIEDESPAPAEAAAPNEGLRSEYADRIPMEAQEREEIPPPVLPGMEELRTQEAERAPVEAERPAPSVGEADSAPFAQGEPYARAEREEIPAPVLPGTEELRTREAERAPSAAEAESGTAAPMGAQAARSDEVPTLVLPGAETPESAGQRTAPAQSESGAGTVSAGDRLTMYDGNAYTVTEVSPTGISIRNGNGEASALTWDMFEGLQRVGAVTIERSGENGILPDRGRYGEPGGRTGGQAEGLRPGGELGETTAERVRAADRGRTVPSDNGQRAPLISGREIGLRNGTDTKAARVIPEERWRDTGHMDVLDEIRAAGYEPIPFTGTVYVETAGGRTSVDGFRFERGGRRYIGVKMDSARLSPRQIARHEMAHEEYVRQPLMVRAVWDRLTAKGDESFYNLLEDYVQGLHNMYGEELERYMEEIFCDAQAGISRRYAPMNEELRSRISETAGQVRQEYADATEGRGPPEGKTGSTEEYLGGLGVQLGEDSAERYSLETWTKDEQKRVRDALVTAGFKKSSAYRWVRNVNGIAARIAADKERLDYEASPDRSAWVSNSEYGGSVDFSTLCKKRRLLTGTFSAIQRAMPDTALSALQILDLRNMMINKGYEVNCGLCYVEGSRAQMGVYAKAFLDKYAKTDPAYLPNMAEANTPKGLEELRTSKDPGKRAAYEAYEYFMNHGGRLQGETGKGLFSTQAKPKLYQLRTSYKGEIAKAFGGEKHRASVKEKNRRGGVRINSFSDFETPHLIDMMQVIMDMSSVGLAGQAYTKVPNFAWVNGNTGLKINLSLIAKGVDANGGLVFDEVEGMPLEDAMALRSKYSKNVGTIVVTFTDAQLQAAMKDSRIDFIIPFHHSQWSKEQFDQMGLPEGTRSYQSYQGEKWANPAEHNGESRPKEFLQPNEYWDFSKSGRENAETYLRLCAEQGRIPKFATLNQSQNARKAGAWTPLVYDETAYDGKGGYILNPDGSADGYWKTLIDFKMYDNKGKGSPQMPVKPRFNMTEAMRVLNEYEGGANTFPVARDVVDEFLAKYQNETTGQRLSVSEDEEVPTPKAEGHEAMEQLARERDGERYSIAEEIAEEALKGYTETAVKLMHQYSLQELKDRGKVLMEKEKSLKQRGFNKETATEAQLREYYRLYADLFANSEAIWYIEQEELEEEKKQTEKAQKALKNQKLQERVSAAAKGGSQTLREEIKKIRAHIAANEKNPSMESNVEFHRKLLAAMEEELKKHGTNETVKKPKSKAEPAKKEQSPAPKDEVPAPKAEGHEAMEQLARERDEDTARAAEEVPAPVLPGLEDIAGAAEEKRAAAAARVSDQTLKNNIRERRRQIEAIEDFIGNTEANPGQARKLETMRKELAAYEAELKKRTGAAEAEKQAEQEQRQEERAEQKQRERQERPARKAKRKAEVLGLPADYADPLNDKGEGKGSAEEAAKAAEAAEKAEAKGKKKAAKPQRAAAETANKLINLFGVEQEDRAEAKAHIMDALVRFAKRGRMPVEELRALENYLFTLGTVEGETFYEAEELRRQMRRRRIHVNAELKKEWGDDWGAFTKRALAAGFYIVDDPTAIRPDMLNHELAKEFPGFFDEGETDQYAFMEKLMSIAEEGRAERQSMEEFLRTLRDTDGQGAGEWVRETEAKVRKILRKFAADFKMEAAADAYWTRQLWQQEKRHQRDIKARDRHEESRARELAREQIIKDRAKRAEDRRAASQWRKEQQERKAVFNMIQEAAKLSRKVNLGTISEMEAAIGDADLDAIRLIKPAERTAEQKARMEIVEARSALAEAIVGIDTMARRLSNQGIENREKLAEDYGRLMAEKGENFIPIKGIETRIAQLNQKQINDMKIEDVRELAKTLSEMINQVETGDKLLSEMRDRDLKTVTERAAREISETKGRRSKRGKKSVPFMEELLQINQLDPGRIMSMLGGWRDSGTWEDFRRVFERATDRYMKFRGEANRLYSSFSDKAFAEYGIDEDKKGAVDYEARKKWLEKSYGRKADWQTVKVKYYDPEGVVEQMEKGELPISTTTIEITPMMRVALYLHAQNNSNLNHIATGGLVLPDKTLYRKGKVKRAYEAGSNRRLRITPESMKTLAEEVKHNPRYANEYAFAQLMLKFTGGDSKEAINRVSMLLDGWERAAVKNYWPIESADNFVGGGSASWGDYASLDNIGSIANERTPNSKNPILLLDAEDTFQRQKETVAKYVGYAIPMRDLEGVLKQNFHEGAAFTGSVRDLIESKWGGEMNKYLEEMQKDLSFKTSVKKIKFLNKLRGNLSGAWLLGNLSVFVSQSSAYITALPYLDMKALGHGMKVWNKVDTDLISRYTGVYDYREASGYSPEAMDWLKSNNPTARFVGKHKNANLAEVGDSFWIRRLWAACEYQVAQDTDLRPGENPKSGEDPYYREVAELFRKAVFHTQYNSSTFQRSALLRDERDIMRLLTMFKTDAFQHYGMVYEALGRLGRARQELSEARTDEEKAEARQNFSDKKKNLARNLTAVVMSEAVWSGIKGGFKVLRGSAGAFATGAGAVTLASFAAGTVALTMESLAGSVFLGEEVFQYLLALISKLFPGDDDDDDKKAAGLLKRDYYGFDLNVIGEVTDYAEDWLSLAAAIGSAGADWKKQAKGVATSTLEFTGMPVGTVTRSLENILRMAYPKGRYKLDNFWKPLDKTALAKVPESARPAAISVLFGNRVEISDGAAEELARLYDDYGGDVLPAKLPTSISVDGEDIKLDVDKLNKYKGAWGKAFGGQLEELIKSPTYTAADDADRVKLIKTLYDYAGQLAKQEAVGAEPDKWIALSRELIDSGKIDLADIVGFRAAGGDVGKLSEYIGGGTNPEDAMTLTAGLSGLEAHEGKSQVGKGQKIMLIGTEISAQEEKDRLVRELLDSDSAIEAYDEARKAGLTTYEYGTVLDAIYTIEPEEGKNQASTAQKLKAVAGLDLSVADKDIAVKTAVLDSGGAEKYAAARSANIGLKTYAEFREFLSGTSAETDENGKSISGSKRDKVLAWIGKRNDLSDSQKTALALTEYAESSVEKHKTW